MAQTPKLPFKVEVKLPFLSIQEEKQREKEKALDDEIKRRQQAWLEEIKERARKNIKRDLDYLRIAWTSRYKIPRYPSIDDYTDEELVLEAWEQFYFENPDSNELKGIKVKHNEKTGYKYFEIGDPLIDELERTFSEGEVPDLDAAFADIEDGKSIFQSEVFVTQDGESIAPINVKQVVKTNEKGEKITEAGVKIEHDDYSTDEWLENALKDDPVLKKMSEKLGVPHATR